jgi:hypothetical protein
MSENNKPAGTYQLLQFKLTAISGEGSSEGVDLRNIVHTWTLNESITSGHIRGSAKVYDSKGVFYNYPILGQERLEIVYKDFKGEELTEDMFVYSVTDVRPSSRSDDNSLEYVLHFVSWGKFFSERFSIKRCFAEGVGGARRYLPVSDQAEILFRDYYYKDGEGTQKQIEIHPTDGESKLIVTNMSPEEGMHLMSRNGYSSEFPSNMFRFFEARNKYWFANIEELVTFEDSGQTFFYSSGMVDDTPDGQLLKMQQIMNLEFGTQVDTIGMLKRGAYFRNVEELDFQTRTINRFEYNHLDEFKNFTYPDGSDNIKLRHTDDMINDHLNDPTTTYVIKDYADADLPNATAIRPRTYYGEIYNNKGALLENYAASRLKIQIYGTNEVFAGSVISLDLPMIKTNNEEDNSRSGKYLVETVENTFFENTYTQNLTVVKGVLREENR